MSIPWYIKVAATLRAGEGEASLVTKALAPELAWCLGHFTVIPDTLVRYDKLNEDQLKKLRASVEAGTKISAFSNDGVFPVVRDTIEQLMAHLYNVKDESELAAVHSDVDVSESLLQARLGPNPTRCHLTSNVCTCFTPLPDPGVPAEIRVRNEIADRVSQDVLLNRKLLGLDGDSTVSDRQVLQMASDLQSVTPSV